MFCWVAFILVGQFALFNIFACLRVAGSWLSLAITIITVYLKTSDSYASLLCNYVQGWRNWSGVKPFKCQNR